MAVIGKINTIVSTNIKPLTTGLGKAAGAIKTFGSKIAGLAALAGGAGGLAAVGAGIRDFASEGAALQKLSVQTGAAVGELSSLRAVAGRLAIDGDDLTGSIEELNIRLGEAIQDGTGPLAESFKKLGLDAEQLSRMPLTDRFGEISDALGTVQNQAERGFLMDEIFGGDAFKIAPLIRQSSAEIRTLAAEARDLGVVMGERQVESAMKFTAAWKTAKIGTVGVLRDIGGLVLKTFDFGKGTASITDFVKNVRTGIKSITPVFVQFGKLVGQIFSNIGEGSGMLFSGMAKQGQSSFDALKDFAFDSFAVMEFGFANAGPIAELLWTKLKLGATTTFENIKHFFGEQVPAVVGWFADNWRDIFSSIFDFTKTVFSNLGKNIKNAMTAIWKFIKSGGRSGLNIAWTPLTDGFKNAVKEMPDIPKRVMTELEKQLGKDIVRMGNTLDEKLGEHLLSRRKELIDIPSIDIPDSGVFDNPVKAGEMLGDVAGDSMASKLDALEGPAAVRRDSAEAFSAIFSAMRGNGDDKMLKTNEQQLKSQRSMESSLKKIAMQPAVELVAGSV